MKTGVTQRISSSRFVLRTILLSLACAAHASADGVTLAQAYNMGLDGSSTGPAPVYDSANGSASVSGSGTTNLGNFTQSWSASSFASAGILKSYASSTITCLPCGPLALPSSYGSPGYVSAEADARWDEVITVAPGQQMASLNFVFAVDGTTTVTGAASADYDAEVFAATCAFGSGACYPGVSRTVKFVTLAPNQSGTVTINMVPWALNTPINILYLLDTVTNADETFSADGLTAYITEPSSETVDFSDTVQLLAIQPVNAAGQVVNDGTVIFDDSGNALPGTTPAPVPEPAAAGAIGFGLLLLAAGRRIFGKPIMQICKTKPIDFVS